MGKAKGLETSTAAAVAVYCLLMASGQVILSIALTEVGAIAIVTAIGGLVGVLLSGFEYRITNLHYSFDWVNAIGSAIIFGVLSLTSGLGIAVLILLTDLHPVLSFAIVGAIGAGIGAILSRL